jgi:hypothetical protein
MRDRLRGGCCLEGVARIQLAGPTPTGAGFDQHQGETPTRALQYCNTNKQNLFVVVLVHVDVHVHGLFCKRRWRSAEEGVLPTQLGPQRPGRVAQPHAGGPSRPGTEGNDSASPGRPRRGDIKVIKSGTSWILDVGIICPGSRRLVSKGVDTIPGKAAAIYDGKKDEDVQLPGELGAVHRRNGRAYSAGSCRWRPRAGLARRRCISRGVALQQGYIHT